MRARQRIAELERQLADLTARFTQLERQAFLVRTLQEVALEHVGYTGSGQADALVPPPPRHLRSVGGGAR